jgi:phosphoribosylaminoimidazole-succinocarboxamide synthase
VTLALANGKTESWVMDRTGHKSSGMINRYRQAARFASELNLGTLQPLDQAIPDLCLKSTPRDSLSQDLSQEAVHGRGVEPLCLSAVEPKSTASASFATRARDSAAYPGPSARQLPLEIERQVAAWTHALGCARTGLPPNGALPMVSDELLRAGLTQTLSSTHFEGLGALYEGKVRDNYSRAGTRFIVVTDRISAFDRVLGTVPFKGQVLNRLAAHWFSKTKHVAENHMKGIPDPNVLECVECEPILVEMVMRSYVTGSTSTSIWTHYEKGARVFCGHRLPDGLKKNQKLPEPILTPTTKAPKGEHDVSGSREEILATGKVTAKDFDAAAEIAVRLFAEGQKMCAERGLILVDTKYELGRRPDGTIVVIDEIHTPDSSRFWMRNTYEERFARGEDPEPLDKDFVRRHFTKMGYKGDGPAPEIPDEIRLGAAKRYIEAFERITGEPFVPNTEPPVPRIAKRLGLKGAT